MRVGHFVTACRNRLPSLAGMSNARAQVLVFSLVVGIATLVLMLATEPKLAIGWDEGYTLGREQRLRDWFRGLRDPARFAAEWHPLPLDEELVQTNFATPLLRPSQLDTRSKLLFDSKVLEWFWPFAREEPHGHPPFYALVGLIGDLLAPSWQDLPRARLGPILFFALTAGTIFFFCATRWGFRPAALAAGSWVLQPNLFGHGHYASYDGLLTSLWVLSIIVFTQAVLPESGSPGDRIRWLPEFGFRDGPRLRRRNQADRLVPSSAVSGLDGSLPQPAKCEDARPWAAGRHRRAVCLHAPLVERAGRRNRSIPRFQPGPRPVYPHQGSIPGDNLRQSCSVAPLVQHVGLDSIRDPGRLPAAGRSRILESPETLAD